MLWNIVSCVQESYSPAYWTDPGVQAGRMDMKLHEPEVIKDAPISKAWSLLQSVIEIWLNGERFIVPPLKNNWRPDPKCFEKIIFKLASSIINLEMKKLLQWYKVPILQIIKLSSSTSQIAKIKIQYAQRYKHWLIACSKSLCFISGPYMGPQRVKLVTD